MITFNGKEFKTRTFKVFCENLETEITIADQTLFDEISVDDKYLDFDTPEREVDEQIYFYVENGELELSPEEICKSCLDIEMEFRGEL